MEVIVSQEKCPLCGSSLDQDICLSCLTTQSTCILCFESFDERDRIIRCTKCNYLGHYERMDSWLKENKQCPVCRTSIGSNIFVEFSPSSENFQELVDLRHKSVLEKEKIFERFNFRLPYYDFQSKLLAEIENDLKSNQRYLLISPPGSGKTIIGLALAQRLGVHTLILTPNLAVLGSWLDISKLFLEKDEEALSTKVVGQDAGELTPITILTYQKLNSDFRLSKEFNTSGETNLNVIHDSKHLKNGKKKELKSELSQENLKREDLTNGFRMYPKTLVERLKNHKIQLIIADEAHRLTGQWGKDLDDLVELFPDAKIVGLTATPPLNGRGVFETVFTQTVREIPLPPLVRAGIVAPYRDLVHFIDIPDEKAIIERFSILSDEGRNLALKISRRTKYKNLVKNSQQESELSFLDYLYFRGILEIYVKPWDLKFNPNLDWNNFSIEVGKLKTSKWMLREILTVVNLEISSMRNNFRGLVIFDNETGNQVLSRTGMGGAIGLFEALVTEPKTDSMNPVFVTGKSLLVDDDFVNTFLEEAESWRKEHSKTFEIQTKLPSHSKFSVITGTGPDWTTETQTRIVTYLFEKGATKLLVGTRHLLGEGWDSRKLNTLFDLTFTPNYASVNQIKGRAFRKDPDDSSKVSNIWEFVISPKVYRIEYSKYFSDSHHKLFNYFRKRHKNYFGISDDGIIRNGLKKFHSSLRDNLPKNINSEDTIYALSLNYDGINSAMTERVFNRTRANILWKVGSDIGVLTNSYLIPMDPEFIGDANPLEMNDLKEGLNLVLSHIFTEHWSFREKLLEWGFEDNNLVLHFEAGDDPTVINSILEFLNSSDHQSFALLTINGVKYKTNLAKISNTRYKLSKLKTWYNRQIEKKRGILKIIFKILYYTTNKLTVIYPPKIIKENSIVFPFPDALNESYFTEATSRFNEPRLDDKKDEFYSIRLMKKVWLSNVGKVWTNFLGRVEVETRFTDLKDE